MIHKETEKHHSAWNCCKQKGRTLGFVQALYLKGANMLFHFERPLLKSLIILSVSMWTLVMLSTISIANEVQDAGSEVRIYSESTNNFEVASTSTYKYASKSSESITLTPDTGRIEGILNVDKYFSKLDDIVVEFEVYLGAGKKGYGADGICVCFTPNINTNSLAADRLGYPGTGVAIGIRTFTMHSDQCFIAWNGSINKSKMATVSGRMDDNKWHKCKVVYSDASISIYFDDEECLKYENVNDIQAGYISIRGATGAYSNLQKVRNISVYCDEAAQSLRDIIAIATPIYPKNGESHVFTKYEESPVFELQLEDENYSINNFKGIHIYRYADDKLVCTSSMITQDPKNLSKVDIKFSDGDMNEYNTKYYVLIDNDVFESDDGSLYLIDNENYWTFTTMIDPEFYVYRDGNTFIHNNEEGDGFEGSEKYDINDQLLNDLYKYSSFSERAMIKIQMNRKWGGACRGLALTQGLLALDKNRNLYYKDMGLPKDNEDFRSLIHYYYLSQNSKLIHESGIIAQSNIIHRDLSNVLKTIIDSIDAGNRLIIEYKYANPLPIHAHAVLAYYYIYDEENKQYDVLLCDSNSASKGKMPTCEHMYIADDFSSYKIVDANNKKDAVNGIYSIYVIDPKKQITPDFKGVLSQATGTFLYLKTTADSLFQIVSEKTGHSLNIEGFNFYGNMNVNNIRDIAKETDEQTEFNAREVIIELFEEGNVFTIDNELSSAEVVLYNETNLLGANINKKTSNIKIDLIKSEMMAEGNNFIITTYCTSGEVIDELDPVVYSLTGSVSNNINIHCNDGVIDIISDKVVQDMNLVYYIGTQEVSKAQNINTSMLRLTSAMSEISISREDETTNERDDSRHHEQAVPKQDTDDSSKDVDNIDTNADSETIDDDTRTPYFQDVLKGAYYHDAVYWAYKKGIIVGTDKHIFSPTAACTRGQIMSMLWRVYDQVLPERADVAFIDISSDAYYSIPVVWGWSKGITSGKTPTLFAPNDPCKRCEVVTFIWRAFGSPEPKNNTSFSDVQSGAYYEKAVAWAAENGITAGTGNNCFSPEDTCTRAQVVTFLYNAYHETNP